MNEQFALKLTFSLSHSVGVVYKTVINIDNIWLLPASSCLIIPEKRKTATDPRRQLKQRVKGHVEYALSRSLKRETSRTRSTPTVPSIHKNETLASPRKGWWVKKDVLIKKLEIILHQAGASITLTLLWRLCCLKQKR